MVLTKPDTGWSWVVMTATFCILTIHGFLVYGSGMVQIALFERFHDSVAKTSLAGSLLTGFLSCSGILDGVLIRRYSCRQVAVSGGILMVIGIFLSAFMTSLSWIIFTFGVVAGFGAGIQYTSMYITIGYNFKRNINLALGFALSGCGIGTFVFTPVFAYIMTVYSLEGIFICLAGLSLQSIVFSVMIFPSSLEMKHKSNSTNTRKGTNSQDTTSFCVNMIKLFKTRSFVVLLISLYIANFGTYIVYIHLANYTTHKGSTEMEAALLLSIIGLCSCVSRILAGLACNSEVIEEPTLLFGTLGVTGVFTVLLPLYSHTLAGQIVFAVAFGLYAGCLYSIMNGITLRFLSLSDLGSAVGIELAVIGVGIMTGPPAVGYIMDSTGNYDIGIVIAGLCIIAGAILTLIAELCNNKKKKRDETKCDGEFTISLTEDVLEKLKEECEQ
ncbi:monocarboxylate transporter 13-like [Ylistrum balloti]|uniref:monocarboxylate transporter 13-like n=1 Tax=Ylistrum balloti TaxID=509963 RepID=UPI002905DF04|nr:monocarboxylate transporter 13-like [Ylistrum balloti]